MVTQTSWSWAQPIRQVLLDSSCQHRVRQNTQKQVCIDSQNTSFCARSCAPENPHRNNRKNSHQYFHKLSTQHIIVVSASSKSIPALPIREMTPCIMWRDRATTTNKNGELSHNELAHENCHRIKTVARNLTKQAPLESARAEDSFFFPVCCVNLPTSRNMRVAVRAFHQKEDDEERERRCDDAIAIDEGKADVVTLLRIFCGTNSSTW